MHCKKRLIRDTTMTNVMGCWDGKVMSTVYNVGLNRRWRRVLMTAGPFLTLRVLERKEEVRMIWLMKRLGLTNLQGGMLIQLMK